MSASLPAVTAATTADVVPPATGFRRSAAFRRPGPGLLLATGFLVFLLLGCVAPSLVTAGGDPFRIAPHEAFRPPGWAHPFGTDQSGRDIFVRIVFGARESLLVGVGATGIAMMVAVTLGLLGGLGGHLAERAVRWLLQVMFSFPVLILALLLSAGLGHGIWPLVLATGLGSSAGYGRLVLSQVLAVRDAPYVEAARALGHSPARIVHRHVLPNAMRPLVVAVMLGVGQAIIWSASLSFLGLGAPPPAAEWGTMLSMGRDFVANAWWLTAFPGAFVVMTVLSTTAIGHALQRHLESRAA
ncbi:ABC transporter permease [Rhizosaccharibacter radicis]|uniref:ABC transporter permease n=1 Tax=Rhizosaccharibacter radicis TaxID=2782605 RepID=A0ABT1W2X3_9PROT|nr:ABC transporter permease [Acetobacteraceae bacterium KSS12]